MTFEGETLALVTGEILPETLCEVETVAPKDLEALIETLVDAETLRLNDGETLKLVVAEILILVEGETLSDTICEVETVAVTQVAWVNMFVDEQEALLELDASWEGTLLL